MSITIKLDLPESVAEEARAEGLLQSEALSGLLERELRRRRAGRELRTMMDRLHAVPGNAMSMEEINAEIKAVRAERRAREAGAG